MEVMIDYFEGVLNENCGASLIVVITKSDIGMFILNPLLSSYLPIYCNNSVAPQMGTAQWEKLLVQIRRFCLSYGAALFYVSSKKVRSFPYHSSNRLSGSQHPTTVQIHCPSCIWDCIYCISTGRSRRRRKGGR